MFGMGIAGAVLQVIAHILMYGDGDVERNLVARYAVGTAIIGACLSVGWLLDNRVHPVTSFWFIAGLSGTAVWGCWERRRVLRMRTTEADARRLARFIAGEHDDETGRGDQERA